MNILFLYNNYYDRRKKYGYILAQLGHNVVFVDVVSKTSPVAVSASVKNIDLVFAINAAYVKYGSLGKSLLRRIKQKNIPLVCWSTTMCGHTIEQQVDVSQPFTHVFEITKEVADAMGKLRRNVHYLPLGFHPEQFYYSERERVYDMCFSGHPQKYNRMRRRLLGIMVRHFDVKVYGASMCRWLGIEECHYNSVKSERNLFVKTRVGLNFPFYDSEFEHLRSISAANNRFFEYPACKCLQLTKYGKPLDDLLGDGKECFYYRNKFDMVDIGRYLLKNYGDYQCVADRAYERVMDEHTYTHRLKKMMEVIGGQ